MTALAKRQDVAARVGEIMTAHLDRVAKMLPVAAARYLTPDRLLQVALSSIRTTPRLAECSPASLCQAIMHAAKLGLEPGGASGHASIVPYGKEAQLIPSYRGLMHLAIQSGRVTAFTAQLVYANDRFDVCQGTEPKLTHIPCLTGDRGDPVVVYAIANLPGKEYVFHVMTVAEVNRIRDDVRGWQRGPWKTHWGEMARKTAVRALCKYLPQSPEAQSAAVHDEYVTQGFDSPLKSEPIEVEAIAELEAAPEREPGEEG